MKIVLFNPKPSKIYFYKGFPFSLLSIASMLKKHKIKIIQANEKTNYIQEVIDECKDADCLGITCMTGYQIEEVLHVAEQVKIPVIIGGTHPSILPQQTLENKNISFLIRGQGERTFKELIEQLQKKKPNFSKIKGLSYKTNKIIHNPERPFEDINNFPDINFNLINIEDFIFSSEFGSRTIELITSQGCPHRCGFCAEQAIYSRRWSGLKAEKVTKLIEFFVKKYKVNYIRIQDANFFVDKNRIKKICNEIIKKKIKVKIGHLNVRTEYLSKFPKELWEIMEKAGFINFLIGAESGSQKALDLIRKDSKINYTLETAKLCKKYNMTGYYSFMVGLPSREKNFLKHEFKTTLNLIKKLYKIGNAYNMLFVYTPYPGAPLYKEAISLGLKHPDKFEQWNKFDLNIKNTPWVKDKIFKKVEFLHNFIFPFYENKYKEQIKRTGNKLSLITNNIFHLIAKIRWKTQFFYFPLEYKLFKLYLNKR